MGGIGKTTIATMVCHQLSKREGVFRDGIAWVKLGQSVDESRILDLQKKLVDCLGGDSSSYISTVDDGKNVLREILIKKNCLIVLDDVWKIEHKRSFCVVDHRDSQSRFLITTRNFALTEDSSRFALSLLTEEEALELLGKEVRKPIEEKDQLQKAKLVIQECGLLPLAVSLSASMAKKYGWDMVLQGLQSAKLDKFENRGDLYQYRDLFKSMEASVSFLDEILRNKYLMLAIFPQGVPIPFRTINCLWNNDDWDTKKFLGDLVEQNLIHMPKSGSESNFKRNGEQYIPAA